MGEIKVSIKIAILLFFIGLANGSLFAQTSSMDSCTIGFTDDLYQRTKKKGKYFWQFNQTTIYPDTGIQTIQTHAPAWDTIYYFEKSGKYFRVDTILTILSPDLEYTLDMSCCNRPFEIIQKPVKRVELEKRIAIKRKLDKDSLFLIQKKTGMFRVELSNYTGPDTLVAYFGDYIGEHKVTQLINNEVSVYFPVASGAYGNSNYFFIIGVLDPSNDIYLREGYRINTDIYDGFYPIIQTHFKLFNREKVTCYFDYQERTWQFKVD